MASKGLREASGGPAYGRGRGAYTVTDTRLTLRQAAAALGVSESAIRKRVERGTLRSDKGADGRRYVYVDTVADAVADEGEDTSVTREHDALIPSSGRTTTRYGSSWRPSARAMPKQGACSWLHWSESRRS